jgi:hypothetical protein
VSRARSTTRTRSERLRIDVDLGGTKTEAIAFGGGLSNLSPLHAEVPSLWGRRVFSDRVDTPLLRPRWGDSSGARGAAWLRAEDEAAG